MCLRSGVNTPVPVNGSVALVSVYLRSELLVEPTVECGRENREYWRGDRMSVTQAQELLRRLGDLEELR